LENIFLLSKNVSVKAGAKRHAETKTDCSKSCFSGGWREVVGRNQNIRLRLVLAKAYAWRFAETETWRNPWIAGNL
jgi:hypothetical protein